MKTLLQAVLFIGLIPVSLHAQEVVEVSTDPVCRDCTISVEHVATLGKAEDPISPIYHSMIAVDDAGNFYVGPTHSPGEIAVYGPTGELLRTLGREGEGPGEFENIRAVRITGGDTLHVFSQWRHTVMSTAGEVIETSPFAVAARDVFILRDGGILANAIDQTPERVGLPAHILGPNGRPYFSFGNYSGSPQGEMFWGTLRRVSFSGDDQVWVTPMGDYRLELWDTAGVHVRTLVRDAPWFNPWTRDVPGGPFRTKPNTKILSVHQDQAERAWVFGGVPDRNWRPGVELPAYEQVYDSVVEVVDLSSGELIISQHFDAPDQLFNWYFSEDLLYSVSVTELGVEQVHVWRMRLHMPEES